MARQTAKEVDKRVNLDIRGSAVEIVKATISLAHSLNIMVVAEGIERPEQWDSLLSLGYRVGQGFHLGRPAPLPDHGCPEESHPSAVTVDA